MHGHPEHPPPPPASVTVGSIVCVPAAHGDAVALRPAGRRTSGPSRSRRVSVGGDSSWARGGTRSPSSPRRPAADGGIAPTWSRRARSSGEVPILAPALFLGEGEQRGCPAAFPRWRMSSENEVMVSGSAIFGLRNIRAAAMPAREQPLADELLDGARGVGRATPRSTASRRSGGMADPTSRSSTGPSSASRTNSLLRAVRPTVLVCTNRPWFSPAPHWSGDDPTPLEIAVANTNVRPIRRVMRGVRVQRLARAGAEALASANGGGDRGGGTGAEADPRRGVRLEVRLCRAYRGESASRSRYPVASVTSVRFALYARAK